MGWCWAGQLRRQYSIVSQLRCLKAEKCFVLGVKSKFSGAAQWLQVFHTCNLFLSLLPPSLAPIFYRVSQIQLVFVPSIPGLGTFKSYLLFLFPVPLLFFLFMPHLTAFRSDSFALVVLRIIRETSAMQDYSHFLWEILHNFSNL